MSVMSIFAAKPPTPDGPFPPLPIPGADKLPTQFPEPPIPIPGLPKPPGLPGLGDITNPIGLVTKLVDLIDFIFNLVTFALGAVVFVVALILLQLLLLILPIGKGKTKVVCSCAHTEKDTKEA